MLAATTLTDEPVVLTNFPTALVDVRHKVRFMRNAGAVVEINDASATLTAQSDGYGEATFAMANGLFPIRTTYLLVAGQIRTSGRARIPYPGGCKIGSRGYDLHLMVWRALGCEVNEKPEYIEVIGNGFTGDRINFPISTVGGTENALMCASIAEGTTEIVNAYITPEIEDLIELLRRMGAEIEIFGNSLIKVHGQKILSGARMAVMSDRIEALTWIVYAIMSGGEIRIDNVPFESMEVPLIHIEEAGVDLMKSRTSIYVHPDCLLAGSVQPFELACGTHPGVISDMQPFFALLGLVANGTSRIFDYRYPERIGCVRELAKMCGEGRILGDVGRITTHGAARLKGTRVKSTDLRGSMALVMAGLCAEGDTVVEDVHMALRGYNGLVEKLMGLGVLIEVRES
ncbi:UDP-N-acetylglucosamine 1-carboxyvinyltransferase [Pseudodesulfovibrio sediminis]|uniref:UDP-N-acetylglucosamine 1-carboxyvinyltransferase n=2 Tax=Pseudodesulfovibrio sediminis TaxID=2810563 RepID=A0ABN6EUE0_9BACT|nr:UDP-N-acetylglucosamine 1-carboxyvinyltransferase [Pseudodesulfovibrio sediminis]